MDVKEVEKQINDFETGGNKTPEEKKKGKIKSILYIAFILIATTIAIVLNFVGKGKVEAIFSILKSANWSWLMAVFGAMLGMVLVRSLIIFFFARLYTRKYNIFKAMAADTVCTFYNAVTPSSTGGEVMEAYTISKQGIPISSAVSMLAMYSILYQFVLIIFNILSLIFEGKVINTIGNISFFTINNFTFSLPLWLLIVLGFLLNLSVIGTIFLMATWKGLHNFIMGPIVSFLAKIKLCKNPDKTRENLRVQVENFKIELRRLLSNIPFAILIIVLFGGYMIIKFSVPFFVGKALGNESTSATFWDTIFLSSFHQMITGLIPLPGAAGVSELFFNKLFVYQGKAEGIRANNSYFFKGVYDEFGGLMFKETKLASDALCSSALLIWRSFTFFFPTIISGIFSAFYRAAPSKGMRTADVANRETFVDLQSQTLSERNAELETILETSKLNRDAVLAKLKTFGVKGISTKTKKNSKKSKTKKKTPKNEDFDHLSINISDEEDK